MEPEYAQNTETGDWDEVAARNMLALEEPVCTAYEVREAIFLLFPEETKQQAVLEEFHNRFPEKDWVKRYPAKATMQILMNALSES